MRRRVRLAFATESSCQTAACLRARVAALVRTLPEGNLAAAQCYLEYLRDLGDAEAEGRPDVERAWAAEIRRRTDALDAGEAKGEAWTKVRARLKRGARA